jgi:hypothetical protein
MFLTNFVARPSRSYHGRLLLLVLLLALLLVLAACGRRAPVVEVEMTPVAGGMVAPAEADADSVIVADADADADAEDLTAADAIFIGQRVTVTVPEGATLRADANANALVLQRYVVGEALDVVEPSGDYEAYPVTIDDRDWVRVRAADGLVGWLPLNVLNSGE